MSTLTARVGTRFNSKYVRTDGFEFYGDIRPLSNTSAGSSFAGASFLYPRQVLVVGPNSTVAASDIFRNSLRHYFLIAEYGTSDSICVQYKQWRVFRLDQELSWTRMTQTIDTVTGLLGATVSTDLGLIRGVLEPLREIVNDFQTPETRYRFITNAALKENDVVGGHKVVRVERLLGVTVAEML